MSVGRNFSRGQNYFAYLYQVVGDIGVASRQSFGGAKDFCPNFPKPARKILQTRLPPKKRLHFFLCWGIFSNQSTSSTIFAQVSPTCLKRTK